MKRYSVLIILVLLLTSRAGAQSIWDYEHLTRIKACLDQPAYATAYHRLLEEADRLMREDPVSVMLKKKVSASGDKHDYVSLSRYFWPDPSKPDGLPYISRDGVSNPELEEYDRPRLSQMTERVTTLSLAWFFSDDENYARAAVRQLRTWFLDRDTRMNPHLNYAQIVPGLYDGKGRCYGVIDAYSFVEMLDAVQLLERSKVFPARGSRALKKWFSKFLDWMLTSEQGVTEGQQKNNHSTAYDVQIIAYARYVGRQDVMLRFLEGFYTRRMKPQIEPDGRQPYELGRTLAFGYSQYNLSHMIDVFQMARSARVSMPPEALSLMEKGADFLAGYLGKDVEEWPYQQIGEWDAKQRLLAQDLYRLWLLDPGREDYQRLARENLVMRFADRFFLLYYNPDRVDHAYAAADTQLRFLLQNTDKAREESADKSKIMPRSVEKDGSLRMVGMHDWCSGFFPGELWSMYQYSHDPFWREQAVSNTWRIEEVKMDTGTHDLGFMIFNSFGRAWRLTGEQSCQDVVIQAARSLASRFDERVGCIRSWSWGTPDRWKYAVIIDNMVNLELLFEASLMTGDDRFRRIAVSHARTTMRNHFREDGSSYHVVDYDPEDGSVIKRITFQGLFDESVWSRGQAWGLYGFTLCYRYTQDESFLKQAQKIADFFFSQENLPQDMIPYWDMRDPDIPDAPRDASSAAVFASGLYELAAYSDPERAATYRRYADTILASLEAGYRTEPLSMQGFLLLHSTGNYPAGDEIDVPINYADYYYLEALLRSRESRLTPDPELAGDILSSGMVHRPMPVRMERSYEALRAAEPVLSEEPVPGALEICFANHARVRPVGSPDDIDYATFGEYSARLPLGGRNLEGWNRIAFTVTPDSPGAQVVNLTVSFQAEPGPDKPGYNAPSGSHLIHLGPGAANVCFLEIGEFRRDRVRAVTFSVTDRGQSDADSSHYRISDIRLQRVAADAPVLGWEPQGIVVSTSGYDPEARKTAVAPPLTGDFQLVDATGHRTVWQGRIRPVSSGTGEYSVLDFSDFDREGRYVLKAGELVSAPFRISRRVWTDARWRAVNFIFCQRCGDTVPGIHSACHTDLFCEHDGRRISYGGGWHDAGDLSQQTLQTGDVAFALLEAAVACRQTEPDLAARLEEEARWGLEFLLHCRFGDGWRASSMGLLHWTDGQVGTADDIVTVRKQDLAFDNFLSAGYEAYAAGHLQGELAKRLRQAAVEDFAFAQERFAARGFEPFPHMMEHTYNTSPSQYMATLSWAASQLFRLTEEPAYAQAAAQAAEYVLACQQTEPLEDGLTRGFFYRDISRRALVHYIHQSREQVYMQALVELCQTQPDHADYARWAEAIRLFGTYLKGLSGYTAPYGMLAAGVYRNDEYLDTDSFTRLHLYAPEDAVKRYQTQFSGGVPVGNGDRFRIRIFPIWFSIFNGNNAVILSQGKAAALCGRFLGDEELLQIGREQLYWLVGKNPFGQSMIFGEGSAYPSMDSFSIGEAVGEMPVGIRTLGDGDVPYWPRTNNACYKEVWLTTAGKFLSLVSEYQ